MPINLRPRSLAALQGVPEPAKGSSTSSSGRLLFRMRKRRRSSGFSVGCRRLREARLTEEHVSVALPLEQLPALFSEEEVLGLIGVVAPEVAQGVLILHPHEEALHVEAGLAHLLAG